MERGKGKRREDRTERERKWREKGREKRVHSLADFTRNYLAGDTV